MSDIYLAPTRHTPTVDFAFSEHRLALKGEAYPENASLFFAPLLEALKAYLDRADPVPLVFDLQLAYMNSASTKMIFQLVNLLNQAARTGRDVVLQFEHDPDDEMVAEFAEDLSEDFPNVLIKVAVRV